MIEFTPWPKTPRLFRDVVITEKIDGTNAAVVIRRLAEDEEPGNNAVAEVHYEAEAFDDYFEVSAQSRKRIITPEGDNHGFARWVRDNARDLVHILGEGIHFGEWWGSGIQRGYGLPKGEKRFSLFNTSRWADPFEAEYLNDVDGLGVVPTLYEGGFDTGVIEAQLELLRGGGSYAAPGFSRPEGICIFHSQSRQVYKVLLENDDTPKSLVA